MGWGWGLRSWGRGHGVLRRRGRGEPCAAMPSVLISGLGLMGGSLAAALTGAGWEVWLHHRRPEPVADAVARGWGRAADDAPARAARCDVTVVCTPVPVIAATARWLAAQGGVVTDVGSVKGALCAELAELGRAGRFVGSHPMAGSHLQGLAHAQPGLYRDCLTLVTPIAGTPPAAVAAVEALWRAVGSRVLRIAPDAHDRAVVAASHLPHVLAAAAAAALDGEALPLAASGFRDTTRVAAGSPALWAGILLANRDAVRAGIADARTRLAALDAALATGDEAVVRAWLEAGRAGRARFDARGAGGGVDGQ